MTRSPDSRSPQDADLERRLEAASGSWRDEPAGERAARQGRLLQRLQGERLAAAEPPLWRLALVGSLAGAAGLLLGLFLARPPEASVEQWLDEWDQLTEYVEWATTAERASSRATPGAEVGQEAGSADQRDRL